MTLRAAIFDHTTIFVSTHNGSLVSSIRQMLEDIRRDGMKIVVFSTHPRDINAVSTQYKYPLPDHFVTLADVGGRRKGTRQWIDHTMSHLGLGPGNLVYIGDDEQDWREAINSGVLYLHAKWAKPPIPKTFTVTLSEPASTRTFLSHFLYPAPRWQYTLEAPEEPLSVRSLLAANTTLPATLPKSFTLQDVFTYKHNPRVGDFLARDLLVMHAVTSLYVEGRIQPNAWWTIYPSSKRGSVNRQIGDYLKPVSTMFHGYTHEDLLIRAHDSIDTSLERVAARNEGRKANVSILDQANSVFVNPSRKASVSGRQVIVFDDFTTTGTSLDWSRELLVTAGAADIVLVSVGKYPPALHNRYSRRHHIIINPFQAQTISSPADFAIEHFPFDVHIDGPRTVRSSFEALCEGRALEHL